MNIIKKSLALVFALLMAFSAFSSANICTPLTASAASAISIKKAPTLKKSKVKTTSVKLSWSKVKKATKYKVYRSTNNKKWKLIKTTEKNSATIKGLKSNKKYYFKVRAYTEKKKGVFSNVVTVKTKKEATEEDKDYIMKTDGGIKLYPITSAEAKKIENMFIQFSISTGYEGKSSDGKTIVVYAKTSEGWLGIDKNGTYYDGSGKKKYCDYCGTVQGRGEDKCLGQCVMSFH